MFLGRFRFARSTASLACLLLSPFPTFRCQEFNLISYESADRVQGPSPPSTVRLVRHLNGMFRVFLTLVLLFVRQRLDLLLDVGVCRLQRLGLLSELGLFGK